MIINHAEILDNRVAVVAIDGPLDSFTSPDFEDYVNQLLAKNILFILFDAGKMEYVSSEGIGLLLFLQRKISEANGFFVMFNLSSEIQTLYRLLGFDKVFRIAESRAEALQIMDRQRELRDRGVSGQVEPQPVEKPAAAPERAYAAPAPERPRSEEQPEPGFKIVECAQCGSPMRVAAGGDYLCPSCGAEFTLLNSGVDRRSAGPADSAGFGSLIVECARCRSLIRVKRPGAYQCPDCTARFTVDEDQTVTF
ncbi:MAG: hypothetical protein A2176_09860 [Spirochaetes bacterium RBG_13_51_14]|nr:MAG: hypothetical protein A2176_09860 [Spirochaetes bacterium RBG_13_51_14]